MTRSQLIEAVQELRRPGDPLTPYAIEDLKRRLQELQERKKREADDAKR